MTNKCTHRAIRSWCTVDGQPVDMWTCVDCGWMFDPRSDTTEHSTNRSADSAESFHKRTSVTCAHGWFRTSAMTHGEMRCIHCGIWNEHPIDTSTKREPVAWMHTNAVGERYFRKKPHDAVFNPQPVYVHPVRQPLTDEEVGLLTTGDQWAHLDTPALALFARAIERAHGIGGEE